MMNSNRQIAPIYLKQEESEKDESEKDESKKDESKKEESKKEEVKHEKTVLVPEKLATSGEMRMIRHENPFLDQIGKIMDDTGFRDFFNTYFREWGDAKAVLMIMYTYNFIDDLYFEKIGKRLSSDELVYLVKQMLHHGDSRKMMVEGIQGMFQKEGNFRIEMENVLMDNGFLSNPNIIQDHKNLGS